MSKLISTNPSKNYSFIGEIEISSEDEIKEKVSKAREAKSSWKEIGVNKRIEALRRIYDGLYTRRDEIALLVTKEMGFPITFSYDFDQGGAFNYFIWYLDNVEKAIESQITFESDVEMHTYFYEPTGVAAVITPWNFPLCNWVWSVVPHLLVGNTVVFKHSEECLLTSKLIENIVSECDLPEGVLSHVYGDGNVGEILVNQEIDLISFTGSSKVGKHLYEIAGKKFIKCLMELGGSAPGIVFEDVNVDEVIEIIYAQRFNNCGQCCDGLKRLLVHENKFDEVTQKLTNLLKTKKVGDPEDKKTDLGPLVAKRQLDLALAQIEDAKQKGAKVVIGGKSPDNLQGAFIEPTILININNQMRIWREEVFAPVLPIASFKTEEEAIQMANDTDYGLGGYVYSNDKNRAIRVALRLETGMVSINGANYVCPWNVFGGTKASGKGREHGIQGLRELCEIKLIAVNR